MSGDIKAEMNDRQDLSSSLLLKKKDINSSKPNCTLSPGTSYEVFRNNTTAVEVIVKDVVNKGKKITTVEARDTNIFRLQTEIDRLHSELVSVNKTLAKTRNGFQTIVREMRKQIEAAHLRESESQAANIALKLENEKLNILLASKTKLLCRTKKEMTMIKRVLKFVVKSICNVPEAPNASVGSDTDYEDFESDLKKDVHAKFTIKQFDNSDTFDTTASRDSESIAGCKRAGRRRPAAEVGQAGTGSRGQCSTGSPGFHAARALRPPPQHSTDYYLQLYTGEQRLPFK